MKKNVSKNADDTDFVDLRISINKKSFFTSNYFKSIFIRIELRHLRVK